MHVPTLRLSLIYCCVVFLLSALGTNPLSSAPLTTDSPGSQGSNPKTSADQERIEDDGVWITLGADAFELLQQAELRFDGAPIQAERAVGDAVATRVARQDIDQIVESLHDHLQRCPGFFAHDSQAEAVQTLYRTQDPPQRGGQIEYVINQPAWVLNLEARIDKARILATIEHLSTEYNNRYYRHPSGVQSATWIRDQWQGFAQGRGDVTAELYEHAGWDQPSVILTMQGSTLPDEVIVLGGHLDSVASGSSNPNFSAPGADDNASGIAVLTEVIRVAMEAGFRPERTVKVMGYSGEEAGLLGSQEIADDFNDNGVQVMAVLQLDMTDYKGSVQDMAFLSDYTNSTLTSFAKDLLDTYQPELEWTNTACGYGCSDHASWHREGYPTVMPSEAIFGQHNPWLHSTSDTVSTLDNNADHAYKFARLAAALMVEIGVVDVGQLFLDGFETGDWSAWAESEP